MLKLNHKLHLLPLILLFIATFSVMVSVTSGATLKQEAREWEFEVPSSNCPIGSDQCHWSSPTLVDFNNDGILDIIIGTNSGRIIVIQATGTDNYSIVMQQDIAQYIPGMGTGEEVIASSPAVADIDSDGFPEIVVGFGSPYNSQATRGGLIVLEHDGSIKPGWPHLSLALKSDGLEKTVLSTPALGDLDKDGDLEIVVGSFDKRIYAWHHDGQLLPGFPPDSNHLERFPDWDDLVGKLADTIWSSPALTDLDGDGYLDIIIGTDEGNYGSSWGGDSGGWTCPYTLPSGWTDYCGGSVYALDRFGELIPGFPQYRLETFQSVPAIADLDQDGSPDIIIGTGEFYHNYNGTDAGFKVYAWDNEGNDLPGWKNGKTVGGTVPASPSIGDIAGDEQPEVIVVANDKKLYAWHSNGDLVSGFPMTPVDHTSTPRGAGPNTNFTLADYDGDGKMEIFFRQSWNITIVDGDGNQITDGEYQMNGTLFNNPAVGDVDNDGKLELIAFNSDLHIWELPDSKDEADWPMFKQNAMRTSTPQVPALTVQSNEVRLMVDDSMLNKTLNTNIMIANLGPGSIDWNATSSDNRVTLANTQGSVTDSVTIPVEITLTSLNLGCNNLGTINFTGTYGPEKTSAAGSPTSINIFIHIAEEVNRTFLPSISR